MMLEAYKAGLEHTEKIVAGVSKEQYAQPTSCSEFDVKSLVNHVIGGNYWMATCVKGETPGGDVTDFTGGDIVAEFQKSKEAVVEAFSAPGVLEGTIKFPFAEMPGVQGLGVAMTETYVHGWDLARSTGQDGEIPQPVAEMLLMGVKSAPIPDQFRAPEAKVYGPEVTIAEDAPASDRVVAYFGRNPNFGK